MNSMCHTSFIYIFISLLLCVLLYDPREQILLCVCYLCLYCIEFPSHSQKQAKSSGSSCSRSKAFSIALYKLNLCSECHLSFHNINLNEHINHNMENTQIKCQFDVKGTRTSMAKKWANSKSLLLRCCFILTRSIVLYVKICVCKHKRELIKCNNKLNGMAYNL